jgi:Tol biopolymer transport system component
MEPITSPPEGSYGDHYGEFSPDGLEIAFFRRASAWGWDLFAQRIGDEVARPITSEVFMSAAGLAWMPDGEEIIFSAGNFRNERLWRVSISGDELVPLHGQENLTRMYPSLSRQGNLLAYSESPSFQGDIWRFGNPRVNASDERPRRLIASSRDEMFASLSAGSRRLTFTSNQTGHYEIWGGNADGSELRPLTQIKGAGSPSWSPDGKLIAFDLHHELGLDIYLVNAESGTVRHLTRHRADDVVPSWSRNNRWVYFASNRSGDFQTWKIPAEGGEAVQITQQGGFNGRESSDGYLYYTKGQEGEIWKVPTEGGNEVPVLKQSLLWDCWDLGSEGIYWFTNRQKGDGLYEWTVHYLEFEGIETSEVLKLELPRAAAHFSVSPDEQHFLLCVYPASSGPDIVLVENFR